MTSINWTCDACGDPIPKGDGHVHVLSGELHAAETRHQAEDERIRRHVEQHGLPPAVSFDDLSETADMMAPWRVHHYRCEARSDAYSIDVGRIDTPGKLLGWTAHLWEKAWFPVTWWNDLIRQHITQYEIAA